MFLSRKYGKRSKLKPTSETQMNVLKQFQNLFPTPPLMVGDVIAFDNGTATVELPDGGRVQARGDVTVGTRVFVQDGVIQGPAPDLTYVEIDV